MLYCPPSNAYTHARPHDVGSESGGMCLLAKIALGVARHLPFYTDSYKFIQTHKNSYKFIQMLLEIENPRAWPNVDAETMQHSGICASQLL